MGLGRQWRLEGPLKRGVGVPALRGRIEGVGEVLLGAVWSWSDGGGLSGEGDGVLCPPRGIGELSIGRR